MGIESDQLVFDYLSRVGDLAQQHQLPSGTRMRLVTDLRREIDAARGGPGAEDSPAAVRRILDRLGSPAELVAAAGAPGGSAPDVHIPRPRASSPSAPSSVSGATPPHLLGEDEIGTGAYAPEPDWWRTQAPGTGVPGFVGGVEVPEMLRPPRPPGEPEPEAAAPAADLVKGAAEPPGPPGAPVTEAVVVPARGWRGRLALRTPRFDHPLLVLAAVLLVAGAVMRSPLPLGLGWLLAYLSRRLTRPQAKWAVFGLPGLVAAGGAVWLWGRVNAKWGDPIAPGGTAMGAALSETWPWVLRGAAVVSAGYLLWRARHRPN
ncbi:hypothetical protein ABT160_14940 [Streptomyces sp. NPDC001941]|uniref:hypothetical protein n=1 Tax=Streptomyces sp. NPDC001941 TaxID=3154659 RepID=UPI00332D8CCA